MEKRNCFFFFCWIVCCSMLQMEEYSLEHDSCNNQEFSDSQIMCKYQGPGLYRSLDEHVKVTKIEFNQFTDGILLLDNLPNLQTLKIATSLFDDRGPCSFLSTETVSITANVTVVVKESPTECIVQPEETTSSAFIYNISTSTPSHATSTLPAMHNTPTTTSITSMQSTLEPTHNISTPASSHVTSTMSVVHSTSTHNTSTITFTASSKSMQSTLEPMHNMSTPASSHVISTLSPIHSTSIRNIPEHNSSTMESIPVLTPTSNSVTTLNNAVIGLAITSVLLIVALILVVYMVRRHKQHKQTSTVLELDETTSTNPNNSLSVYQSSSTGGRYKINTINTRNKLYKY